MIVENQGLKNKKIQNQSLGGIYKTRHFCFQKYGTIL